MDLLGKSTTEQIGNTEFLVVHLKTFACLLHLKDLVVPIWVALLVKKLLGHLLKELLETLLQEYKCTMLNKSKLNTGFVIWSQQI